MNRFLRAGENGGLLTDCRELSPNHTATASSSSSSSSSISITTLSSSSSSSATGSADRHAALPSLQTRGPVGGGSGGGSEPRRSALKRSRAGREGREEAEDQTVRVVQQQQQQRLEAQGRSDGVEMLSAVSRDVDGGGGSSSVSGSINNNGVPEAATASPSASCAKGKEERKGKNVIRGWKRERDRERDAAPPAPAVRTRKEKPGDGSSPPPSVFLPAPALPEHHLCRDGPAHCLCTATDSSRIMGDNGNVNNNSSNGSNGGGAANKSALECGVKSGGGAIVVRRQHDDTPAAKKHRGAEKVDPMFTVPAPPAPGHPGGPGSSLPSVPSFSPPALPTTNPKQLVVRTRSIGTNTQDGAGSGALEGDSACLGPCQPGTSVNLEGIVWHETEEGVLVVNVTWRKRTYVGTLLDCTKHDWAPPRFCESPSSDPELPGGRGRGKRMRMALGERPCIEPAPATKVRGLSQHRSRGGGVAGTTATIHNKGRRGSLNLINSNCRAPPSFFTVDEVKPANSTSSLSSGKRKNKPPAELDLSLVSSEDIKNGNGKRIRAKSRSAPSTPQGKSDPSFMDPGGGCASSPPPPPILIDCPHPNCTKRYKHINGLRYHQTHAHLEVEEQRKPELEPTKDGESEERLSDCDDTIGNLTFDLSETNNSSNANSSSKKPAPLYKVTTVGSPKNRRLLLSTDHSPTANSKTRRTSLLKDGLIDDLSNLPIISNMTVVLENCMVPDRNSTVEMPKLEAEGLIDKKGTACDKGKKANGKVEKLSKSRTNRLIAPAPAPPKLIAIPNTAYPAGTADSATSQQPSPMAAVGLTSKNLPLKPIKPKLSIVVEPNLVKTTLVTCSKETRKKEKRRLKDKHKDLPIRTPNGDNGIKLEDSGGGPKMGVKEISGSLLKEHLSKQDVINGLSESQESRMASIRAEADKVYTFTDNAPSPSIGGSSRLDSSSGCLVTADSNSKNNSPAYSDISDAGDDGGSSECRSDGIRSKSSSSASSEVSSNCNHGSSGKTPPTAPALSSKDPQSPYYHNYDPYYLQGYMQSDRQNSASVAFHKNSALDGKGKDRKDEVKEDDKSSAHEFSESKKGEGPPQSQLQLAMSQTQTALAQSLYYGQYSRGLYMDQKLLMGSKCCDQLHSGKQRGERGQGVRDSEEEKHMVGGSAGGPMLAKGPDGAKGCCPKPVLSYVEMSERGERGQGLGIKAVHGGMVEQHQGLMKDCDDMKSSSSSSSSSLHNPNSQTDLDSNVSFSSPSDGPAWAHCLPHSKYSELQSQHGEEAEEGEVDRGKEWGVTVEPTGAKMTSGGGPGGERGGGLGGDAKKARIHGSQDLLPVIDAEDSDRLEGLDDGSQEPMGGLSEESQSARAAVSPPMTPQQPYIQYQHSSYQPYLSMCESGGGSYRGVSPTLIHNYPGFHYPLYGKTAGREESEVTPPSRGGAVSGKQSSGDSSSSAMELLQQQSHQYHGKSPAPGEKGSPEGERETERERNHVSFARHLHTHHHTHLGMSYNLMSGQYDIYQGLSSRSLVSSQQVSGHSSTDSEGKK
ncbi:LOW QUALITY PROTEIN: zinc finger protein 608 [Xyrichtys novacula]|uniref:LOW QUALITY PROTEIN: zinc finger protein 608 n=1 Tax=Xyrichtys novacula TaxID=13765 RepID=A0AAV1G6L5_XYRNO|nr:LOW QUALITY PROTEIN: zinc finger protein 608 [Xyrichtys novacula]